MIMDHSHGVANNKCTHPECVTAWIRYRKQWRLNKGRGNAHTTDAANARAHIATLEGKGWSRRAIAAEARVSKDLVTKIANGQPKVRPATERRILAIDPRTIPHRPSERTVAPFVPKIGTIRRIQALLAMGWPHHEMQRRSGIATTSVIRNNSLWVTRATYDAIATLYRELSQQAGPSPHTRGQALRLGYHSPADWDDIDNDLTPDIEAVPRDQSDVDENVVYRLLAGELVPATTAERREVVARWHTTGRPFNDLARLTGWKVERYHQKDAA